jgi:cysteine desulfurase
MSVNKMIYADNAATTRLRPEVLEAMMPYLTEQFGNASSIYKLGRDSEKALVEARKAVADLLGVEPRELFFTSGGSESDNWAIRGAAMMGAKKGKKHIITSAFEHHAVLHTVKALEKDGFEITYLPVYEDGLVRPEDLRTALRDDTALVTIMYANNEIGTIQPIQELGAICREAGVWFHTDAVQAFGHIPIDIKSENIDMLSMSAHKLGGPKGVGMLYVKKGVRIPNLIEGGAQESGHRAGTENVAGIVGLAKACELAFAHMDQSMEKLTTMRNKLIDGLLTIPKSRLNGDRVKRLPGNVNISFVGVEGESLLLTLDAMGICASSGSACTTASLDPSHVLLAIGLVHEVAHGSLRISLSDDNTMEDVEYIIKTVPGVVEKLRAMSPLWEHIMEQETQEGK